MRRWFIAIFVLTLFISLLREVTSQASEPMIWNDAVEIEAVEPLTPEQAINRQDCSFAEVFVRKYPQPLQAAMTALTLGSYTSESVGRQCVTGNAHGYFTKRSFARSLYSVGHELAAPATATQWVDPAPRGEHVAHVSKRFANDPIYRISLSSDYSQMSEAVVSGLNVKWLYTGILQPLTDKNGATINNFIGHAFSSNGQFLAVRYANTVSIIDLMTKQLTPVGYFSNWQSAFLLAVSNDGQSVAVRNNGLFVFDAAGCNATYSHGNWDLSQQTGAAYTGCSRSQDLLPRLIGTMNVVQNSIDFKRLYFSPNGASIFVGAGVRKSGTNPNSSSANNYDWTEYRLRATRYQPAVAGYLAMGDSFSSGEGDLHGGSWYEPGTNDFGNEDTFEGRNLCHLSRRSYPYLIAKELGLLGGGYEQPVTPSSQGLFHSVACSGAVMHNVKGESKQGLVLSIGDIEVFKNSDNQYYFSNTGSLSRWQPGRVRQLDHLLSLNGAGYQVGQQKPEVITIGIGGNDAGFGDIIKACVGMGTCDVAQPQSPQSAQLAITIAQLKPKLTETYAQIKQASPDSRVYVHGYPNFVRGYGGSCGVNVRFDVRETAMIEEGIRYMNSVVEAAARTAGVSYVDITDIFTGRRLCDDVHNDGKAVNGATAGDDKDIKIFGKSICVPKNGCVGNESYHPNSLGHELYRQEILRQTQNFSVPMPPAAPTMYPLPKVEMYGVDAHAAVSSLNDSGSAQSITITEPKDFVRFAEGSLTVNQGGFLAGSSVRIEIHSTPQVLDEVIANENGIIDATILLPETLEAGAHQIQLYGINEFGENTNYYQQIVVGENSEDFDDDEIANETDPCPYIENSLIDEDGDGVDDACDPEVFLSDESIQEFPIDDAEPIDKGVPNGEAIVGNEQVTGGAVLGVSTEAKTLGAVLAQTGSNSAGYIVAGLLFIGVGVVVRKRAPATYRIRRK